MGSSQISQTYEDELIRKIEEAYESFVKRNESKHILYAYRTPAVLATIMVLSYLISSVLDTMGVESLSRTAIFGLYIPLILTLVWLYVKYSGDFREVGQFIDNVTSAIWEQVSYIDLFICIECGILHRAHQSSKSHTRRSMYDCNNVE